MVLRSLRSRLIGAFGLIVLLMILLSGVLSIWATTSRFDILVTEESRQRAREFVPLLEASYDHRGGWSGLDGLLTTTPSEVFDTIWYDTEWWGEVATALGVDNQTLANLAEDADSLAAVAEAQGVDPDALVQAIVESERAGIDAAVALGHLMPSQVEDELASLRKNATYYIEDEPYIEDSMMPDWDVIVADELDMSQDEMKATTSAGSSIANLAEERGIAPAYLVGAILKAEKAALRASGGLTARQIEWELADIISQARIMIESEYGARYPWVEPDDAPWLFESMLVGGERLLVADTDGRVIFDSVAALTAGLQDERLPAPMLDKGAPLWDYAHLEAEAAVTSHDETANVQIGTVIITAGPSYYTAHQSSFLRNVSASLVVSALTAGIVALLVGLVIAQRITAPVTALTEATRHLASGDWATRLSVRSEGELGQMSAAFNAMAQALETQRELRSRLVDDIAHELNTPLSVIQLELEALKDGMQTSEQAMVHVGREIELLRNLADDLTLLAETDKGTLQLDLKPTDLVKFTAESVARWRRRAEAVGVELRMEPSEPLPLVQADPLRLAQVLGNLISNAFRYTPSGGHIEVKCRKSVDGGRKCLLTTVSDSGEGIPPDDLPYVFDRFYRVDRSRSRRHGGRELGLAIAKQIVELHGGRVWVESQPGVGSTFYYSLRLS